eukprot:5297197-Prymnesium_polylepis.1
MRTTHARRVHTAVPHTPRAPRGSVEHVDAVVRVLRHRDEQRAVEVGLERGHRRGGRVEVRVGLSLVHLLREKHLLPQLCGRARRAASGVGGEWAASGRRVGGEWSGRRGGGEWSGACGV